MNRPSCICVLHVTLLLELTPCPFGLTFSGHPDLAFSSRFLCWTKLHSDTVKLLHFRDYRQIIEEEATKEYASYGFKSSLLTNEEQRRTIVLQDQGFKVERVEERLNWAIENMGIFPIWTCYIHIPEHERVGKWNGCTHLCDIGLYGVPSVSSYRCNRHLREWQLSTDETAAWGELFLSKQEAFERISEFGPHLSKLRKEYKAEGSFKSFEEKMVFYDETRSIEKEAPTSNFRIKMMWRESKTTFFAMCVVIPVLKVFLYYPIKAAWTPVSWLGSMLLPTRSASDEKSKVE